jgi:hypothetical protein
MLFAACVALACLWVPWRAPVSENLTKFLGYSWIWVGPTGTLSGEYYKLSTIDYGRTALEILALASIFGIAFLVTPARANVKTDARKSPIVSPASAESRDNPPAISFEANRQTVPAIEASERYASRGRGLTQLMIKRILATGVLWAAADLVAAVLISATGVSKLSNDAQVFIWLLISVGLLVSCAKLSWAKIR